MNEKLLDKRELQKALGLPSVKTVENLMRRRKIPVILLGYRTRRFDLAKVRAAIDRLTVKEIGA